MNGYWAFSSVVGVFLAVIIIWLVRRDHMHVRYSLWWLGIALGALVFGLFPSLVDWLAPWFGVAYPPALLFLLGLVILTLKGLLSDIDRSDTERRLIRLIQRMAILDQELALTRQELGLKTHRSHRLSPEKSPPE
ncbi:MAG: DUF2304 domain-containing protein [Pseudomonadota bacterium]